MLEEWEKRSDVAPVSVEFVRWREDERSREEEGVDAAPLVLGAVDLLRRPRSIGMGIPFL